LGGASALAAPVGTLPGFAVEAQATVVFHPGAIAVDGGLHFGRNGRIFPDTDKDLSNQAGIFFFQAGKMFLLPFLRYARELCQCGNHVCIVVRKPEHAYGCHIPSLPCLCPCRSADGMHARKDREGCIAAISAAIRGELLIVAG